MLFVTPLKVEKWFWERMHLGIRSKSLLPTMVEAFHQRTCHIFLIVFIVGTNLDSIMENQGLVWRLPSQLSKPTVGRLRWSVNPTRGQNLAFYWMLTSLNKTKSPLGIRLLRAARSGGSESEHAPQRPVGGMFPSSIGRRPLPNQSENPLPSSLDPS